jgi:hypothetical protein
MNHWAMTQWLAQIQDLNGVYPFCGLIKTPDSLLLLVDDLIPGHTTRFIFLWSRVGNCCETNRLTGWKRHNDMLADAQDKTAQNTLLVYTASQRRKQ